MHCFIGRAEPVPDAVEVPDCVDAGSGRGRGSTVLFAGGVIAIEGDEPVEAFGTKTIGLLPAIFGGGGGSVDRGLATTGSTTLASNLSKVVEPCDPPTPSSQAEKGGERISIRIDLLPCFEVVALVTHGEEEDVELVSGGDLDFSNCSYSRRTRA